MATIVITGANRGIGLALVQVYASAGNHVVAWCRDPARAEKLQHLAAGSAGTVQVVEADVADAASVDRAAAALNGAPVDVLLNVAGIFHMEKGVDDRDFDGWRQSFEVMVIGPFRVAQALLPNIEKAKGKILTVTSQIGSSVWATGGMYSYGAAKAGVNRVMKSLAVDLRDRGVAVAVVHPGHVQTDMGGPNAAITAEESATGIRDVVNAMTLENSGGFFKWDGDPHPW
ncbi:SDR family oxidoreductase [Sphingobium phenoxybenzoativorans]|uniref:SDR family oxidoreductase n=1 Tax=Sphingobium phenoxybenzoativorans TaxID=1592790 RepID=A0A975K8D6_9SPHN|nr:SDR family oxidoreductase [Sphingobium phenoxybenzoativorans]QUT06683.1 SDR family oxidoreductase [Sphingobium phenoxybenzoativorans]